MPAPERYKLIHSVFEDISKLKKRDEKIEKIRSLKGTPAVMTILKIVFDPAIKFSLPEGNPPYKPAEDMIDNTGGLYRDFRKFKYFFDDPRNTVHPLKRETMFIELLESLHPLDAALVLSIKDKKLPYKGITEKLVREAVPGLIS